MTDPSAFRAEFPVFERLAYLNAGSNGPVPRRAIDAAAARQRVEMEAGRSGPGHWEKLEEIEGNIRERLARLLGCSPGEVALTGSTTDGVSTVMSALELGPRDEVLTSDEEHPGVLGPLAAARARRGFEVRFVPFAELAGEVGPTTKLVVTSHVSWISGRVADTAALAATQALVLLDGAQGLGAVPLDVAELGCDFYAASGQKWLCGPERTGCLYVRGELIPSLPCPWPSYATLADPERAFELDLHPDARRFDLGGLPGAPGAWWRASLDLLDEAGWDWVHDRAATLAAGLADRLSERGLDVAPRDTTTLVAWRSANAAADVERLAAEGIVVREMPGRGLARASVGAWSSEDELERLATLAR